MATTSPRMSACIVAYCDYEEVCAAVRSVLAHTPSPDFRLFVVDNASPDGCGQKLLAEDFGDPRVTVRALPENLGFGKGHNSVLPDLAAMGSEIHFILNPDILLTADTLTGIAAWMAGHPAAAMATPQLFYPDGRRQDLPRRKPTPWLLLARQLAERFPRGVFAKANDHYLMRDEDLSAVREIEFCTGSFAAIRTEIFAKIGGFDPEYFMYVEDADLTQKALRCGKAYLLPQFSAIHAWHRAPMRDAGRFRMQLVSMGRYFKKWGVGPGRV